MHVGQDQMYEDLTTAIMSFGDGLEGTVIVHPGEGSYDESVTVDGGRVIAFLAADIGPDDAPPLWVRISGNVPQLTVLDGTALLDGIQLSSNASSMVSAVVVNGGRVRIDRSRIVQNSGGGVRAQGNSTLVVRSSFVSGNGVGGAGSIGIDAVDTDVDVLYSTLARNDSNAVDSIHCSGGTFEVRNSIVVGRDANSIDCPGISVTNSAVDEPIGGNANVGAANLGWFVDGTGGDFHLGELGVVTFRNIAVWADGDPTTDIDGQQRPAVDGLPDSAGADRP